MTLQELHAVEDTHTRALLHSPCIAPRNKKASEASLFDSDEGMLKDKYQYLDQSGMLQALRSSEKSSDLSTSLVLEFTTLSVSVNLCV